MRDSHLTPKPRTLIRMANDVRAVFLWIESTVGSCFLRCGITRSTSPGVTNAWSLPLITLLGSHMTHTADSLAWLS